MASRRWETGMGEWTSSAIAAVPALKRGIVWCRQCGRAQNVDSAKCLTSGWPKCCSYTMTIDSPAEQKATEAEGENQ